MPKMLLWAIVGYAAYRMFKTQQQPMPTTPMPSKPKQVPLNIPPRPAFAIEATPFSPGPVRPVPPAVSSRVPMPFIPTGPNSEIPTSSGDAMTPGAIPMPDLMIAAGVEGSTYPACIPAGQNIVVEDCPDGQSRACGRKAPPQCAEDQKVNPYHQCGACK